MKRSRGRNRRSGGNPQNAFNNPNRHYESVGPDVKIRGSAQQVLEKYLQYARDAQTSGDRILSEAYFQFAEHYQRIVAKQTEARNQQQSQQSPQNRGDRRDDRDNRPGGDRNNSSGDGGESADEERGEAVVTSTVPRRNEDEDSSDALRVIDSGRDEDDDDRAEASADESEEGGADEASASGERGRSRRKPYRPREDKPARARKEKDKDEPGPVSETDGVMKTLSRGRRRPATEEAASAETTD